MSSSPREENTALDLTKKKKLSKQTNKQTAEDSQLHKRLTCFPWSLQSSGRSLWFARNSWTTQTWSQRLCHRIQSSGRPRPRRLRSQLSPWCLEDTEGGENVFMSVTDAHRPVGGIPFFPGTHLVWWELGPVLSPPRFYQRRLYSERGRGTRRSRLPSGSWSV